MKRKIKILLVEKCDFPKGWGVRPHSHEYYHLLYVLSGKTGFIVDDKCYDAKKDTCFIVPPNTIHEMQKVVDDTVTCYEVKFYIYDQFLIDVLNRSGVIFGGNPFLEELMLFIVNNGLSRAFDYSDLVETFLYTFIAYQTRESIISNGNISNSHLIDTTGYSEVSSSIVSYIEENYTNQINLDMIAASIGYNKNYICSVFKKDTGIPIIDYLNFVRIRQVVIYLSYSEIDVSLACTRVGFLNVSHFNRTFKKFTGLSPTAYKKMYPLDLNSSFSNLEGNQSGLELQMTTIANAFGLLNTLAPNSEAN